MLVLKNGLNIPKHTYLSRDSVCVLLLWHMSDSINTYQYRNTHFENFLDWLDDIFIMNRSSEDNSRLTK